MTGGVSGGEIGSASAPLLPARRIRGGCGATWLQTLVNIVVSIVGTGVLGLPYAFRVAGWLAGTLGVAAAGVATYYCMTLLVDCRRKLEEGNESTVDIRSYGDLGYKALGSGGHYFIDFLVVTSQAGGAVAYLVFIGQNLSSFFSAHEHPFPASAFIFVILLPLEIALSFIQTLSSLAPFSAIADACNVLSMAIVIKDDFQLFSRFFKMQRNAFNGIWGLPFAGGVAVFCFEGFSLTLPLESSMADRGLFQWVLSRAFIGITGVYICFGLFGYMAYGEDTRDIITLNLPNDWSTDAVKVGLCVALVFTFPMMMHPIYDVFERLLHDSGWLQTLCHRSPGAEPIYVHLVRALIVAVLSILASYIPGFGAFISFVGSTVCALLSFVLPAYFHLIFVGPFLSLPWRLLDYLILIAGLIFAVYGIYSTATN